jgi:hypothetical protein
MRRRVFTALSVLSALLLVLAAAAWPRTLRIDDHVTYVTRGYTTAAFGTGPSRVEFTLSRGCPPIALDYFPFELPIWRPGWSRKSMPWNSSRTYDRSGPTMKSSPGDYITTETFVVSNPWTPPAHEFLGIGWESRTWTAGPPMYVRPGTVRFTRVVLPLWLVTMACAILPARWIYQRAVARRRKREGHCPACGYDLRASKERCPECGKPIVPKAEAAA